MFFESFHDVINEKGTQSDQIQVSDQPSSKKPQINTRKNRKEKKKRPFFDLCWTGGGRRGYKSRCQPFLLNGLKTVTLQKDKASLSGECNRSSGTSFKTIRASKGQLTCTRNPGSIRIDRQPNSVLSWWPPPILPAPWLNPYPWTNQTFGTRYSKVRIF